MIFRLTGMVADARCGPATLHDKTCQVYHDDVVSAPSLPGPQDHARRVPWSGGTWVRFLSLFYSFFGLVPSPAAMGTGSTQPVIPL